MFLFCRHLALSTLFLWIVFCSHCVIGKRSGSSNRGSSSTTTTSQDALSSSVKTLTDIDFDLDNQQLTGFWVMKFYAPWCGHCKAYKPIFEDVASQMIVNDPNSPNTNNFFNFGEVDCDKYPQVCTRYNVRGYPTTLLLLDGHLVQKYQGDRSKADIKDWILSSGDEYYESLSVKEKNELKTKLNIKDTSGRASKHEKNSLSDYFHHFYQKNANKKQHNQKNKQQQQQRSGIGQNNMFKTSYGENIEFNDLNDVTFNNVYKYFLGDTHPSVPAIIYIGGTLFGIFVGVVMVLCCTN